MISNSDPVEPLTAAAATSAVAVTASSSAEGQPAPPATPNIVMSSKDHDSLFSGGGIRCLFPFTVGLPVFLRPFLFFVSIF